MKTLIAGLVLLGSLATAASANAQYIAVYSPPVVAPYAVPVIHPVYAPAMVYRPPVVAARPFVPPVVPVTPVIVPRPAYHFYTPYGGSEIRVPGRPVANAFHALVP